MIYNLSMRLLSSLLLVFLISSCTSESNFQKYVTHVETLSSDEFEGRAPGTPGGIKTKNYIANHYASLGLKSFGDSYLLPVNLTGVSLDVANSSFDLSVNEEVLDLDYRVDMVYGTSRQVENVNFDDSDLVFVGYGVNAPEYGWNDYKVDVTGNCLLYTSPSPRDLSTSRMPSSA